MGGSVHRLVLGYVFSGALQGALTHTLRLCPSHQLCPGNAGSQQKARSCGSPSIHWQVRGRGPSGANRRGWLGSVGALEAMAPNSAARFLAHVAVLARDLRWRVIRDSLTQPT